MSARLFIDRLKRVSTSDYALRFAGPSEHWYAFKEELLAEMRAGYAYWDSYEWEGKGAWIVNDGSLLLIGKDYFGDALLQHMRVADARYETQERQRHAG